MILSQAFSVVRFLLRYAIPICVFIYCYGRIFYTIRRQSKVVGGHQVGRNQAVTIVTTSRDQNPGQVQQQATGATTGGKLSRTEMNVLQTMIAVIVCFLVFWSVREFANLFQLLGVSISRPRSESESERQRARNGASESERYFIPERARKITSESKRATF